MILNVSRKRTPNRGDLSSAPCKYLRSTHEFVGVDILDCDGSSSDANRLLGEAAVVIVGGGGLLDIEKFYPALERILEKHGRKTIIWGAGSNSVNGFRSKSVIDNAAMIGLRDELRDRPGVRWVPCASCMHPLLKKLSRRKIVNGIGAHTNRNHLDVGFFENNAGSSYSGIRDCGYKVERVGNKKTPIEDLLSFIADKDIIVSSSYHGCYWSILLGTPVIGIPTSSKFSLLPQKIPLSRRNDWPSYIETARCYPSALGEALSATTKYIDCINKEFPDLRLRLSGQSFLNRLFRRAIF